MGMRSWHATNTRACDLFGHRFHFDSCLTVHTSTIHVCVFVLMYFQERFQIDAFSVKALRVFVWTEGLNGAYKGNR